MIQIEGENDFIQSILYHHGIMNNIQYLAGIKMVILWLAWVVQLVEQVTNDPTMKGSNTASTGTRGSRRKTKMMASPWPAVVI